MTDGVHPAEYYDRGERAYLARLQELQAERAAESTELPARAQSEEKDHG